MGREPGWREQVDPRGLAVLGKSLGSVRRVAGRAGLEGLKQQLVRLEGRVVAVGQGAMSQDEQRKVQGQTSGLVLS